MKAHPYEKRERTLERIFKANNPQGMTVTLECGRGCQPTPIQTFNMDGESKKPSIRPLTWPSKVLAIDHDGPLYADPFCPNCTCKGHRETITEASFDGFLLQTEIDSIGQRRIHTLLFLFTQMLNPNDYRKDKQLFPFLSSVFIAKHTAQKADHVEDHIAELHAECWIDAASCGVVDDHLQYKLAFDRKFDPFFARIEVKKETQVAEAPRMTKATDCGHESPYQVMRDRLRFLTPQLLEYLKEEIAVGNVELHKPLLCPSCSEKEAARNV